MVTSLDVFDCSVSRLVFKPTDLFDLIEKKVGRGFAKKRINAEQLARKTKPYYNFDDLYKFLPEFDKITEINTELENCVPIQSTLDMYKQDPKKYIFVSDMYLPSDVIKQMLIKCGYENPTVFVSCEYGCGKRGGELFKRVEAIVGKIEKHYGDNYKSDILGAKEAGIEAELVPCVEYMKCTTEVKDSRLKKYLATNDYYTQDLNTKVARYFAPLVYSFTKWILDCRKPGQKIFFNARDGYLPFKIAQEIIKAEDIYYSRISRKSILPCGVDFSENLNSPSNQMIFDRLVLLRVNDIEGLKRAYKYPHNDLVQGKNIRDTLLINQDKLYTYFKECKENAKVYLQKLGISEGDMFVDIGYYGSLQYALEKVLGFGVKGYYTQSIPSLNIDMERYTYFDREVLKYKLLIETVFSSSENGVNGYTKDGEPIYYEDCKQKKCFSQLVEDEVIKSCIHLHQNKIEPLKEDVEALTRRFLYYPTLEESYFGNEHIFENGDTINYESITWYDRDKIKAGELQECYDKSYWRIAFLKRLREDRELSYLEKYLDLRGGI